MAMVGSGDDYERVDSIFLDEGAAEERAKMLYQGRVQVMVTEDSLTDSTVVIMDLK